MKQLSERMERYRNQLEDNKRVEAFKATFHSSADSSGTSRADDDVEEIGAPQVSSESHFQLFAIP